MTVQRAAESVKKTQTQKHKERTRNIAKLQLTVVESSVPVVRPPPTHTRLEALQAELDAAREEVESLRATLAKRDATIKELQEALANMR